MTCDFPGILSSQESKVIKTPQQNRSDLAAGIGVITIIGGTIGSILLYSRVGYIALAAEGASLIVGSLLTYYGLGKKDKEETQKIHDAETTHTEREPKTLEDPKKGSAQGVNHKVEEADSQEAAKIEDIKQPNVVSKPELTNDNDPNSHPQSNASKTEDDKKQPEVAKQPELTQDNDPNAPERTRKREWVHLPLGKKQEHKEKWETLGITFENSDIGKMKGLGKLPENMKIIKDNFNSYIVDEKNRVHIQISQNKKRQTLNVFKPPLHFNNVKAREDEFQYLLSDYTTTLTRNKDTVDIMVAWENLVKFAQKNTEYNKRLPKEPKFSH